MNATTIMKKNTSHPIKIMRMSHPLKIMMMIVTSRPLKIVTMIVTNRPLKIVTMVLTNHQSKIVVTMIMTSIFERNVIGVTPTDANATTRPIIVTTIPNTVMMVLIASHPKKRKTIVTMNATILILITNHLKKRRTNANRLPIRQ